MSGSYIEILAYHYLLESDKVLMDKVTSDFFDSKILRKIWDTAKDFTKKYLVAPTREEMWQLIKDAGRDEEISYENIDSIYSQRIEDTSYTVQWLRDKIVANATWKSTANGIQRAAEYYKRHEVEVGIENVETYRDNIRNILNKELSIDYSTTDSHGFDFWNPESHKQTVLKKRQTGYDFMDKCMDGGYWDGSFVVFLGAPKIGKSHFLCNCAAKSVELGYNTLYVTLELPEPMINRRIGSNMFNVKHSEYPKISDDVDAMRDIMQKYKKKHFNKVGDFVVKSYPTSSLTPQQLEAYILSEEERLSTETFHYKFQNVFVDYINIMKSDDGMYGDNTYLKIKSIAEGLKGAAVRQNWAMITATQTTRSQYGKSDIGGEDVSESSALSATVDIMFGIIRDKEMITENSYYIKCIYDRVAEYQEKRKKYLFNNTYLRLDEDTTTPIESAIDAKRELFKSNTSKGVYNAGVNSVYIPKPVPQSSDIIGECELVDDLPDESVPPVSRNVTTVGNAQSVYKKEVNEATPPVQAPIAQAKIPKGVGVINPFDTSTFGTYMANKDIFVNSNR